MYYPGLSEARPDMALLDKSGTYAHMHTHPDTHAHPDTHTHTHTHTHTIHAIYTTIYMLLGIPTYVTLFIKVQHLTNTELKIMCYVLNFNIAS